jgi:type I restriction enzyme S subunit
MKSHWPVIKLGDKDYFEILGSGIERFGGEKEYLSTSSIEGNKIIAPECKITYQKRPSRANMQPRLNSVWFARMINTIKVYSFTENNKDEIDKYILSTGFAGILCNPEKVDPRYIEKIFLSKWFNDLKDSLASDKAIQKSLNNDDIANLEIPLPPLPIQQKIVKILDTIQEAIDIQDKIVEKTKELKKSLMAELFKYGGPSFRKGRKLKQTEIGEIPEDWEVVRLGEIAEVVRGGSPRPKGDPRYFSKKPTGIHWITIADITKYKMGQYIVNTDEYVTKEAIKKSRYLEKGTLVLTNSGTVGIPAILGINGCIHDGLLALLNLRRTDLMYLYYYFDFTKQIFQQIAPKGTQANLNTIIVGNFKIPLPSLPEQQEIAEILQTVDQKIEIERRKKELYEELFKTMLNKIMNQEIDINLLDY